MASKKLLFLINSLETGGAERVTAHLANHWAQKNWDITLVTFASADLDFYPLHPTVKRVAFEQTGYSGSLLTGIIQDCRVILRLRAILRKTRPEIALGFMVGPSILLVLAALGLPGLRTIGCERSYPPKQPLSFAWRLLRRYSYRLLDAVTVFTRQTAQWTQENTCAKKIAIIPNAVFYPLLPHAPCRTPEKTQRKRVLAVGRLEDVKGFDSLIRSFSGLAGKHQDWDLIILGEGSQRGALEGLIQAQSLENRVLMPGKAGNVGDWYEAAELFVLSSSREGFPNALLEALAYGLPAVSFDCDTGPRDIIRHGVDGLLVPPGDISGLACALDTLMSDPLLRLQMAANALEVRGRFADGKIIALWERLFAEVCRCPADL